MGNIYTYAATFCFCSCSYANLVLLGELDLVVELGVVVLVDIVGWLEAWNVSDLHILEYFEVDLLSDWSQTRF